MKRFVCWMMATALSAEVLPLTLQKAVAVATAADGNLRLQLVRESIAQAETRRRQALSAFLPNVDGALSASNQTRNLQAFGIQFPKIPGLSFPSFAGPFTVVDYRASASQSILDLASMQRYQAAKAMITVAELEAANSTNLTVQQVARAYVLALEGEATVLPHAHPCRCCIEQINCFIRQLPPSDVTAGKLYGSLDGIVGNQHFVMVLVKTLQS